MAVDAISGASSVDSTYYQANPCLNDTCFWKAYNYNPVNFTGASDTTSVKDTADTSTVSQQQLLQEPVATKSKSSAGTIITSGLFVAGAAACIAAAYKGNGKGIAKMIDGFKQFWRWGTEKLGLAVKKGRPKEFTIRKEGENVVCTLKNRLNRIKGGNMEAELKGISSTNVAPELSGNLAANGIKARAYEFEYNGLNYVVRKGKVVGVKDSSGFVKLSADEVKNLPNELKTKVTEFEKGNNWDELLNLEFSHSENGVSRLFTRTNKDAASELKCAITDRYNANSDAVRAYLEKNNRAKVKMEAFTKGELNNLAVLKGEYQADGIGTFIIEHNTVTGIRIDGKVYSSSSDKFIRLKADNKEIFDKVMEHKAEFTNAIFK